MNAQAGAFVQAAIPDLGNAPIPAKAYFDPAWFELERQAIFLRTWFPIGHVCEVPESGNFFRREVEFARASLLIVRGKDGTVRAVHNACTHSGTQLTDESCGKQAKFSCRYHMWIFGTDGALLSAPYFERFGLDKKDCGLKQVACDVHGGLIFINFDREPRQTLREFLGPLADGMAKVPCAHATHFSEYVYDIDANWKLTYDNFQESYHLRFIHTNTGKATFSSPIHSVTQPRSTCTIRTARRPSGRTPRAWTR